VQDLGSDKTHPEAMSFNVKQYLLKSQPVADPGHHINIFLAERKMMMV
jgi:hypothetical protein